MPQGKHQKTEAKVRLVIRILIDMQKINFVLGRLIALNRGYNGRN